MIAEIFTDNVLLSIIGGLIVAMATLVCWIFNRHLGDIKTTTKANNESQELMSANLTAFTVSVTEDMGDRPTFTQAKEQATEVAGDKIKDHVIAEHRTGGDAA